MITTILALIILTSLAKYIVKNIKTIKIEDKEYNNDNFWMFTYDFKMKKKESIFDKESSEIINKKRTKNKLIVLLYINTAAIFIYVNHFFAKILMLILDQFD